MRIEEVTLFTNNIKAQKHFYAEVLGLEQLVDEPHMIAFKIGESVLSFQYKSSFKPSHLAFNIPSYQEEEALKWLEQRVEILDFEGQKISDFVNWNAKAMYFYDSDNNILEFIARRNLNIENDVEFSSSSLVSISEMAIATNDIESLYQQINRIQSIPIFYGDFDRFCAVGNDEGLFILIDKAKKTWYPTLEEAFTSDFIIKGDYNFSFINGKLQEMN
ncbi:VOC family protein [Winogradskyella sp. 3972H.M.0a.05]|uniref:VOC family protein n=1 Tax=Winogradskyella sp. 3972H.M.0a.05 TaxID=2950277 RepID=UPI003392B5E2